MNDVRPIDADALKRHMGIEDAVKYGNETEEQQHNSYATLMNYEIADYIDDMPTLDYAPVVHGEWEWFEDWGEMQTSLLAPHDPPELFDYGWRCSHCKTYLREAVDVRNVWDDPDEKPVIKCCPECGAKMDGGKAK